MASVIPRSAEVHTSLDSGKRNGRQRVPVEIALLAALAYADLFDYPLTREQLIRYQVGTNYNADEISAGLIDLERDQRKISTLGKFYALRGSESSVETRKRREGISATVWRRARLWGRFVAATPFVRGVAVTGALSMNNISGKPDIDLLVIAEPGRVWICRRFLIVQVRIARLFGDDLCPNYILSARTLNLEQRDFFTAHELAQMIPISDVHYLNAMLTANSWAGDYLPAATMSSRNQAKRAASLPRRIAERVLSRRLFDPWEAWELRRLRAKLAPLIGRAAEVVCSPEQCKGHTGLHRTSVMVRYRERLQSLGIYEAVAFLFDEAAI